MLPDITKIMAVITTPNEDGSTALIQQWCFSKHYPFGPNRDIAYAFFVWAWAQYYGGARRALPCSASNALGRDPHRSILLSLAKKVALQVYGTCTAGPAHTASNWGLTLVTNSLN